MMLTRRQILAAFGLAPLAFIAPAQARPRKPKPRAGGFGRGSFGTCPFGR